MSEYKKKNYYVSAEFVAGVKALARAENLSEGRLLEKIFNYYSGKEEMLKQFDEVKSELRIQKKMMATLEDFAGTSQKMLAAIAEIQGVYSVVENSNLLLEAEQEWKRNKHEAVIKSMNQNKSQSR